MSVLIDNLRQMIAVLEAERQALAALDADTLFEASRLKERLCANIEPIAGEKLDPEARTLAITAQRLNEVNRQVRNLLAANVAARLEAVGGPKAAYAGAMRAQRR